MSGSVCAFKETRNKTVFFKNISWYCQMILHVGLHKVGLFLGHVTSCRNFSNFFLKTIISVISDTGFNVAIYEGDVGVFSIYGFKHLKSVQKKRKILLLEYLPKTKKILEYLHITRISLLIYLIMQQ